MEAGNASARKASKAGQATKSAKTASKPKASSQGSEAKLLVKRTGRPDSYDVRVGEEFCKRIALGRSLRSVCDDPDMPSADTVLKWNRTRAEFAERYAQAREDRGLNYGDKIGDLVDKVLSGEYPPDVARVAIDALKWTAARLAPKVYGDKQQVEVTADIGVTAAKVLMDLTQQARDAKAIENNVIDVTPTLIGENTVKDNK